MHVSNSPASSAHSNVAPASPVKLNSGDAVLTGPFGPAVIAGAAGLVMSMLKARVAGVLSRLPAASTARTDSVCAPGLSCGVVNGFGQVVCATPSRLHSNVAPASDENVNVGVVSLVGPLGPPVIVVLGSPVSTVTVRFVAPLVLVAASIARAA